MHQQQFMKQLGLCINFESSRMPSSGMRRHVTNVGTDVSEEHIACIIKVTKILD
jgi:hypothetical protein